MASRLFFVYWHVGKHGQSAVFEDDGSAAMKFAMNLQRMGYPSRVTREAVGNPESVETIHESDDWLCLHDHIEAIENGDRPAHPIYDDHD